MTISLSRLGLPVMAALLAACSSSVQLPASRVASSAAAVRSAHEVGADGVPEAALHVRMAEDQMRTAQQLIKDGESEKARMLLARSQADAELAIGLTRATKAKAQAEQAQSKLQTISQPQGNTPVPPQWQQ